MKQKKRDTFVVADPVMYLLYFLEYFNNKYFLL